MSRPARRIRDAQTGAVYWWSFKDRCYHDRSGQRSFPASYFYNYQGDLLAFVEEVAA